MRSPRLYKPVLTLWCEEASSADLPLIGPHILQKVEYAAFSA